ncbi:MAG: hypothetical protein NZ602_03700 [Thermoguttaceae bacterium]|nr:hypothetical protein [Thermoguttaceae bacterium]MDW8037824.1 hypothetical protein [Thermoguttaceae bacterium]
MEPSQFDPYLKWLGIRGPGRPPNHYRLLGLNLFESDPDVISHAADARIAHVRNFCTGPHRALAEKILEELKTAKSTLLDPAQKAAYDQQLQAELGTQTDPVLTGSSVGPPPLPRQNSAGPTGAWENPVEESPACLVPPTPPPARLRESRVFWFWSLVGLVLLLSVGAIGAYLAKRSDTSAEVAQTQESESSDNIPDQKETSAANPDQKPKANTLSASLEENRQKKSPEVPAEKVGSAGSTGSQASFGDEGLPSGSRAIAGAKSAPAGGSQDSAGNFVPKTADSPIHSEAPVQGGADTPTSDPTQEKEEKTAPSLGPGSQGPSSEKSQTQPGESPAGTEMPTGKEKSSLQAPDSPRHPVPSAEEQKRAEAMVRELFKKDLTEAKLPPQKLALAEKLFQEALSTQDDLGAAYVLFGMASGLAAAAGDLTTSIEMIDTAAERFQMNTLPMKLDLLNKALSALRTAPQPALLAYELADLALTVMDEAILADQIEQAEEAYKLASSIVKRSGDPDLIQEVLGRNHAIQVLRKHYEAFRAAQKQLADNPDDPAAHAVVGRWQCFFKGLWEKGLAHLARGQPAELATLAQNDLQSPQDPKDQFRLAERWLKYAESEAEEAKGHIQLRAAYWYRQALPELSGLEKISSERQLEKLPTTPPLFSPRQRGEVVPGNVALEIAGAQVVGTNTTGSRLIDGRLLESDLASAYPPATWTINLPKVYRLREIRLLLPENLRSRPRSYGYIIAVSRDGKRFVPVVDRSKGQWLGWQVIRFPARPVRAIQLMGFREPNDREFYAAELEAYCICPKYPPGTPSEAPPGVASEAPPVGPRKKERPGEENQPPGPREKKPRKKPPGKGAD